MFLRSPVLHWVCLTFALSGCQAKIIPSAPDASDDGGSCTVSGITLQGTATSPAFAPEILSGKEAWDSQGNLMTGTMAIGAHVTGGDGALSFTIPQGYYNGTQTATAADPALLASNIRSGATIFGVAGDSNVVSTGSGDATAADLISGKKAWVDGAEVTGTLANNATWDLTQSFATEGGAGYYNAVSNPPNASQIREGATILGVAGELNLSSFMASQISRNAGASVVAQLAAADQPTATQLLISDERNAGTCSVPAHMTRATCEDNLGTWTPNALAAGYRKIPDMTKDDDAVIGTTAKYALRPSVNCGTSGSIAARVADCLAKNGARATWEGSINGNRGQGMWNLVTRAAANREVWRDERTGLLWSSLVSGLVNWCRASGNTQFAPLTLFAVYNNAAGTPMVGNGTIGSITSGASSLSETITITFSSATAFSVGSDGGASGCQGGTASGALTNTPGSSVTWSKAGVCSFTLTQGSVNFAASDRFILKSLPATQSCAPGGALQPAAAISYCAEAPGLNPPAGETWTDGGYSAGKGGMGLQSAGAKVEWRLPTLEDYRIASANGILLVMPDTGMPGNSRPVIDGSPGGVVYEWSATLSSQDRSYAWIYSGREGWIFDQSYNGWGGTRCVGR